jgi:lysophospholipase L1-like esterase
MIISKRIVLISTVVAILARCTGASQGDESRAAPPPSGYRTKAANSSQNSSLGSASAAPFVISIFGDSHTAGDGLTSRLRRQLGKKYGDAGRGVVAMGRPPIKHYYQRDVQFGSGGDWTSSVAGAHHGANQANAWKRERRANQANAWKRERRANQRTLGSGATRNPEPYGLTGVRMISATPGASAWVATCDNCDVGAEVTRFVLVVRLHPNGAQFRYRIDEQPWQSYDTNSNVSADPSLPWAAISVATPLGPHRFTIEHDDLAGRTLEMFGVILLRRSDQSSSASSAFSVDSLGLVGRRLLQLASWDWSIIGPQLALRNPSLVMLQYGTNEADDPDLQLATVGAGYDRVIAQLRKYVPTASIVIVGPPDLARQSAACLTKRKKRRRKNSKQIECRWQTPDILTDIIHMQRDAAFRNHVTFFDSQSAMGGANQMDKMVNATPRLAATDHTHFTTAGYERWADTLLVSLAPLLAPIGQPTHSLGSGH